MSFLNGLFGSSSGPDIQPLLNFYQDQYNSRLKDITSFGQELTSYNTQYSNALGNMYNTAFSQFAGNLGAAYGAKGMDVNGGAFASELARNVTNAQAQMAPAIYSNAEGNATNVQNRKEAAWNIYQNEYGSALNQGIYSSWNRKNQVNDMTGNLIGGLAGSALGAFSGGFMGGNPFSVLGASMPGAGSFAGSGMGSASASDLMNFYKSEAGTSAMNAGNSLFR